jgi:site-specific DNA-methyltransferase (adenine-specific)
VNKFALHHGDCLEILRGMPDASVDAVVTDPPYGLSFMGKRWDYDVPAAEVWTECLRVLKPGGHLLAFAGTRTQHRMAVRIEDAGFEIRDMIAWVYGSGFPKSLDVSKAIDKAAGAERSVVGHRFPSGSGVAGTAARDSTGSHIWTGELTSAEPITAAARQWQGWGTALKPAMEPITVARKPLAGTAAATVLEHGTGALNVDGCRVLTPGEVREPITGRGGIPARHDTDAPRPAGTVSQPHALGRWPANLIHDGSEGATGLLGDAARFFYSPKASKRDREDGLEGFSKHLASVGNMDAAGRDPLNPNNYPNDSQKARIEKGLPPTEPRSNTHPTVKPTDLMRYLCRLVTPPGGTVLDPFMGSGSTGKAAMMEGFGFVGIEREAEYLEIARARITAANDDKPRTADLFSGAA